MLQSVVVVCFFVLWGFFFCLFVLFCFALFRFGSCFLLDLSSAKNKEQVNQETNTKCTIMVLIIRIVVTLCT